MKKLKAFAYVFKNSISNFAYYKELKNVNVMFSIKYYAMLGLILSVVLAGIATFTALPTARTLFADLINTARNIYPDDLIIKSDGKEWEINKQEPLVIPLPGEKRDHENLPANLIVFDHNGTVEDFKKADTLILINKTNMLLYDQFNGFKTVPVQGIPSGEYTKEQHNKVLEEGKSLEKYIPAVMFAGLLFSAFIMMLIRFIGAYFLALFTLLGAKSMNIPMTYLQAFQIALHTFTVPMLAELFLPAMREGMPPWFMTIHLAFIMIVLIKLREMYNAENKKPAKNPDESQA